MNRITTRFGLFTLVLVGLVVGIAAAAFAASNPTPTPTGAILKTRVFNDCPTSDLMVENDYPSVISFAESNLDCFGFANLHVWHFTADGVNEAAFDNNASYRFSADFKIEGDGNGEGGLQVSPWWSHDADGLFNVRSTDGEIACFGGRLPFFTFTGAFGLHYVKGDVIRLGIQYEPRALNSSNPAQITYTVDYNGNHYTSGPLGFDQANPAEDPPHGLWGELNDARVGGHFKAFLGQGTPVAAKASFTNIKFETTPTPNGAFIAERVFNDCPTSTLVTTNNYPDLISFDDSNLDCFGYANLHVWQFSEDGGTTPAIFNNNANYRFGVDFKIEGDGNGEGGVLVAPWWSKFADGLFNVRSTDGEIACFGGRLPFYTFTGAYGLHYAKGNWIHLEVIYEAHGRTAADPATITYNLDYLGTHYSSGPKPFDQGNPAEDPPYGAYGSLNWGAVGGHFKAFLGQGSPVAAKATFANISFSHCLYPAALTVDVKPHDINMKSKGKWVTAYIRVAAPLLASDINPMTLTLNGVPAETFPAPKIEDHGSLLKVKFSRQALIATLSPGKDVPVLLTGEIGSGCIESTDYIKVKGPKMHAPADNAVLTAGQVANVTWDVEPASNMSLLFSPDDGTTWTTVASNIPNSGSYNWVVPSTVTSSARLLLTAVYETDETGIINQSEYSSTGTFAIQAPLSVGPGVDFSLRVPNPVSGKLTTSFSLPSNAAAELAVFDVAGRAVVKREVGGQAGTQSVSLGALPAGVYVVRLSQAGRSLSNRIAVVQ